MKQKTGGVGEECSDEPELFKRGNVASAGKAPQQARRVVWDPSLPLRRPGLPERGSSGAGGPQARLSGLRHRRGCGVPGKTPGTGRHAEDAERKHAAVVQGSRYGVISEQMLTDNARTGQTADMKTQ